MKNPGSAYKVVRVLRNGDRVSVVASKRGWQKTYIHNGKVIPVDNAFVFTSLWYAQRFMESEGGRCEIWICKGVNRRVPFNVLCREYLEKGGDQCPFSRKVALGFIENGMPYYTSLTVSIGAPPAKTILLDKVELMTRVDKL